YNKNMNKKITTPLSVLIILLVIAVIVGMALWLCPKKETALPQDETAGWQTYQNEEEGYLFKYPKEWKAVTNKYNSKNALFGPGATSESGYGGVEFNGALSAGQSLKDFVKEFNSGVESGSVSETATTVNGQAVIVSILPKAATEPIETKSVSFEKDGKVFNMYLMYKTNFTQYPEDEQRLTVFNQMLSTFKFIKNAPTLITQVVYICNGNKKIEAAFYKGETKPVEPGEMPIPSGSVKIVLSDGRNFNLPQTVSADGGRYANSDESFVFWSKGDTVLVLENNAEKDYVGCVVLPKKGIIVISPNGGETWTKGQKVKISWSAAKEIKFVNIRLSISGPEDSQNFNAAIVSNLPNTGKYEWTVQNLYAEVLGITALPASDKYLITIEDSEHNNVYDMSDVTFSIK
ncbi:MAG: MliC family protein, partial [Candidatus Omnitrophota bacterium]